MEAKVTTAINGKKYNFSFRIHFSEEEINQRIEPEFYAQNNKIPKGAHHEVEITEGHATDPNWKLVHWHPSAKDGKNYICWTGQLKHRHEVAMLINMWCVGTTYTLATGEDFAKLFERHKLNPNSVTKMEQVIKEKYGVTIPWAKFSFN